MFFHNKNAETEILFMSKSGLLYWKTASLCIQSQEWSYEDLKFFTWVCLENDMEYRYDKVATIICNTAQLINSDITDSVDYLKKNEIIDENIAEEIWILSRLKAIKSSKETATIRFEELQDVLASAGEYPRYLYNCDQYHVSNILPFDAMDLAITELEEKLCQYDRRPTIC